MSWQVTRMIKHGVECLGKSLAWLSMEWNVLASHSYN